MLETNETSHILEWRTGGVTGRFVMFPLAGFGCRIWSLESGVWGSGLWGFWGRCGLDWIALVIAADVDNSMGLFGMGGRWRWG